MLQLVREPGISKESSSDSEVDVLPVQNVCAASVPSQGELRTIALSSLIHHPMPKWKRWFDFLAASFLLVVLTPLLALICVFIRCVSKGPVLFSQERLGEMGKYFVIYKFRTLHPANTAKVTKEHRQFVAELANQDVAAAKPNLKSRLIPWGGFLRSTSLDELPQLFNVLKGEMSLIGPRPDVIDWQDYPVWQLKRFEVTPGITGLWQVSGKNRLTFRQMVDLDIRYIQRRSVLLDMWILVQTVRLLLKRDNK